MSKFWAYFKTKQFRNTLLIAVGSVLVVIFIIFFSLGAYTRHGEGIPVPQLKGMQVEKALDVLKEQGFEYKIDSVYVLDQPPGAVVEQDPDAGTNVKVNRTIYLTVVTRLAPNIALPDLEPYTYREAAAIIANYGLKIGDTTTRSDIANHVLEVKFEGQVIKPGTTLPKGSRIDLVLGNGAGPSEVEIPELVNQDINSAKFAIKGSGLTVGTVTYQGPISDSSSLVVVAQSPIKSDSLSKVSLGTRINITVSQSKPAADAGN
jgi:beta-lactam-binding protein with PASTA domain